MSRDRSRLRVARELTSTRKPAQRYVGAVAERFTDPLPAVADQLLTAVPGDRTDDVTVLIVRAAPGPARRPHQDQGPGGHRPQGPVGDR
jgi:hypothetical protein